MQMHLKNKHKKRGRTESNMNGQRNSGNKKSTHVAVTVLTRGKIMEDQFKGEK